MLMKPVQLLSALIAFPLLDGLASAAVLVVVENIPPGSDERLGGNSRGVGGLSLRYQGDDPVAYHGFVGQTFIPEQSGTLSKASFLIIAGRTAESDPLEFSLVRVMEDGGFSAPLDTAFIPFSMVPQTTPGWEQPYQRDYSVTADFTGGVNLVAGEQYAIIIGSLGELGSHYRIWGPSANSYDTYTGGTLFQNDVDGVKYDFLSRDLFFRIEADVIPEVSSTLLLLIACAGGLMQRRRP